MDIFHQGEHPTTFEPVTKKDILNLADAAHLFGGFAQTQCDQDGEKLPLSDKQRELLKDLQVRTAAILTEGGISHENAVALRKIETEFTDSIEAHQKKHPGFQEAAKVACNFLSAMCNGMTNLLKLKNLESQPGPSPGG